MKLKKVLLFGPMSLASLFVVSCAHTTNNVEQNAKEVINHPLRFYTMGGKVDEPLVIENKSQFEEFVENNIKNFDNGENKSDDIKASFLEKYQKASEDGKSIYLNDKFFDKNIFIVDNLKDFEPSLFLNGFINKNVKYKHYQETNKVFYKIKNDLLQIHLYKNSFKYNEEISNYENEINDGLINTEISGPYPIGSERWQKAIDDLKKYSTNNLVSLIQVKKEDYKNLENKKITYDNNDMDLNTLVKEYLK